MTTNESIICAGYGGQGIMVVGKFLATAGMTEGFNVTWLPSYGAEVRGGTAHADVRISSALIANPIVFRPRALLIMNEPSLSKFEPTLEPKGLLVVNSSMVTCAPKRKDIDVLSFPLTDEAIKLGNIRVANIIAAGVYAAKKKLFKKETLIKVINEMAGGKEKLVSINLKAIERGFELAGSKF